MRVRSLDIYGFPEETKDKRKYTPEMKEEFLYTGDAEEVSTLLSTQDTQSFINYQDYKGRTPLHCAAANGQETVMKQLIEARCNVDLEGIEGCTPLHFAALVGHAAITTQLLAASCNVDLKASNGATALKVAERFGQGRDHADTEQKAQKC